MTQEHVEACIPVDISDNDVYEAMKDISGYIDITPGDFKEVYLKAYQHALQRLTQSVNVEEVMTKDVAAVAPDTPLKAVAEVMAQRRVSGVPVIDADRKVVGIISNKDFLSHMGSGEAKSLMDLVAECLRGSGCVATPIGQKYAADIMSSPPITIGEGRSVIEAADLIIKKNINRIPVVDSDGKLVGIVARADIVRFSSPRERT
jgi:CBS domain-containing membrane protein